MHQNVTDAPMADDRLYDLCKSCGAAAFRDASKCPKCGAKMNKSNADRIAKIVVGVIGVVLAFAFVGSLGTKSSDVAPSANAITASEGPPRVHITYDWRKTGFDSIMEADFIVFNDESYPVKDIEIRCDHFAPSGTKIDSNTRTIFEVVQANSHRNLRKVSMGFIHSQVERTSCGVTKAAKL